MRETQRQEHILIMLSVRRRGGRAGGREREVEFFLSVADSYI
jgi:hypothetical protein